MLEKHKKYKKHEKKRKSKKQRHKQKTQITQAIGNINIKNNKKEPLSWNMTTWIIRNMKNMINKKKTHSKHKN